MEHVGHCDPSTGQEQGQLSGTSTTFLSIPNCFFLKVLPRSLYKNPAHADVHGGKDWGKRVGEDWRKLFANEEVQGVSAAGGEEGTAQGPCVCCHLIPVLPKERKSSRAHCRSAVCLEELWSAGSGVGCGALSR